MEEITKTITIPACVDDVWKVVSDFHHVNVWDRYVKSVTKLGDVKNGVGLVRECHYYDGKFSTEKLVEFDNINYRMVISIIKGISPIENAKIFESVTADGESSTNFSITLRYDIKDDFLGKLLYFIFVKRNLSNVLRNLAQGLADNVTTGKYVGENGILLENKNS